MTAPLCATCKWWGFGHKDCGDDFPWSELRPCGLIVHRLGYQEYDDKGEVIPPVMPEARAYVVDGSGYYAALKTASDFGCIKHEEAK